MSIYCKKVALRGQAKGVIHMKKELAKPIVYQIDDNDTGLKDFEDELKASDKKQEIILDFPTVYIHNWQNTDDYEVYIGESNNIIQRTKQHYDSRKDPGAWQHKLLNHNSKLYIIGHEHFNKSLTLDIENRLMLYMMSVERVKKIHNRRGNPQNKYYPENELDTIFRDIWTKLRRANKDLFPAESAIKDSAVFKASPLHKLTNDQEEAKELIIQKVMESLQETKRRQLIFVEGEAGTGKTVLNSSTFYELYNRAEELKIDNFQCYMMVNHNEQITVYEQITKKLGITDKNAEVVCKPTSFINNHKPEAPVDVAFVDEAHLLLTQGKQSYTGKNQLQDIIDRAKVTVVMFDENQILTTEQFWEAQVLDGFRDYAKKDGNYIELKNQLRMTADQKTIDWIDAFTKDRKLEKIPVDPTGYEIRIFDQPMELESEIKRKANSNESSLSRLVATYDWEYNAKGSPKGRLLKYWEVMIEHWHKPWNYELQKEMDRNEKKSIKSLAWAEQPQTIDEVGSTFTIQGFDLNYVGVILGPSVKYRNGEIIFDPVTNCNEKVTRNRTLSDGSKKKFGEKLVQHEVRVLMTRGVNGLYIYAYDPELRNALKEAAK